MYIVYPTWFVLYINPLTVYVWRLVWYCTKSNIGNILKDNTKYARSNRKPANTTHKQLEAQVHCYFSAFFAWSNIFLWVFTDFNFRASVCWQRGIVRRKIYNIRHPTQKNVYPYVASEYPRPVLTYITPRTLEGFLLTLSILCTSKVWRKCFFANIGKFGSVFSWVFQRIVVKLRKCTNFDNDELIYVGVYYSVVCLIKVQLKITEVYSLLYLWFSGVLV